MRKKGHFSIHKSPFDVYLWSSLMIFFSLLISWTNLYNRPVGDLFVSVYLQNELIEQHSLYDDAVIVYTQEDYPFMLGDVVLEINQARIRVEKETSPLNICSRQGWMDQPGFPLICAPNSFMAVIEVLQ